MTKEEMQRYLNQQAEAGIPEEQALKNLADVLGISYPKLEKWGLAGFEVRLSQIRM